MYHDHQSDIRNYALLSPKHTLHVIGFVLASINQKFHRVESITHALRTTGDTRFFSERQRKGWRAICSEALCIHEFACRSDVTPYDAIHFYSQLPGLGIAKAGFVAQLIHGVAGCLDTHWLKALGLSKGAFNASGTTPRRRARMIGLYVDTLRDVGSCGYLWDTWCHTIASLYPDHYADAEHVSRYHWEAITGKMRLDVKD